MKLITTLTLFITIILSIKEIKAPNPLTQRLELKADNIGTGLYQGQVVTQAMKRPQKWFFNVMMQKPNEKYFKEAQYNGLRYQTEMMRDKLEEEYNNYKRDLYEEKYNIYEQKLLSGLKSRKRMNK